MNKKEFERLISKKEAIENLKKWLKPGDTVYVSCRHVSQSGMSRVLQLHLFRGGFRNPTMHLVLGFNAARATDSSYNRDKEGIVVKGCGMDMGFHIVYELAGVLFGDGYKLKHRWI